MEGEKGYASVRVETDGEVAEKSIESGKLVIHGDAQRLKNAADRKAGTLLVLVGQSRANGRGQ